MTKRLPESTAPIEHPDEVQRRRSVQGRRVRLDWREYFRRFVEAHGAPIVFGGRLLFRDGWTYSATDHAGPEWPPPDDPRALKGLQTTYLMRRLQIAEQARDVLMRDVENLRLLSLNKSLPLVRRGISNVAGEVIVPPTELDLADLEGQLLAAEQEVADLKDQLEEVSHAA